MSLHHAHAKRGVAEDMLATPHATLKDRLIWAATEGLLRVDADDLPAELRSEFEKLSARLTSRDPVPPFGSVESTVSLMDDSELDKLARKIRGLAHAVELEVARLELLRRSR